MLKIMASAILACGLAGTASAATGWSFEKIAFPPRQGWCPAPAAQDNPPALEVRPCGEDFPALSLAIEQRSAARQDLARLAAAGADKAESADGKKLVLDTVQTGREDCEENSFAVQRSPMPGVPSFAVVASYICSGNQDAPVLFNRFTAYAQGRDGAVWVIGFDHPAGPIFDGDRAMIKAVIAKIMGH
jgi:hypothetical protein